MKKKKKKKKKKGKENLQGILTSLYISYFSCAKIHQFLIRNVLKKALLIKTQM
jgi:hypothetical protein